VVRELASECYYSLLRWRADPVRDEARNVAVLLLGEGNVARFKAAPVSALAPGLREQGLLDQVLRRFEESVSEGRRVSLGQLEEMRSSMIHSLYFTPPQPASADDPDMTVEALYKALVHGAVGGGSEPTKGRILDGVIAVLRKSGLPVARGLYIGDFIFDAVIDRENAPVLSVLSFASVAKTARPWTLAEKDAAHFLFALDRVRRPGVAIVKPPEAASSQDARVSHGRVVGWFGEARCPVGPPEQVRDLLEDAGFKIASN